MEEAIDLNGGADGGGTEGGVREEQLGQHANLILIVSEPIRPNVRQCSLDFLKLGLQHWDAKIVSLEDLSAALDAVAGVKPTPTKTADQRSPGCELKSCFSGFDVSVTIIFNAHQNTVKQTIASALNSPKSKLTHVIYAGCCDDTTGSWLLGDGILSPLDLVSICTPSPLDTGASPSDRRFHLHTPHQGTFAAALGNVPRLQVTYTSESDVVEPGEEALDLTANVMEAIGKEVREPHESTLLATPTVVGTLSRKDLSVYVFPAEDSDCFLFGVRGFTMLVNGGYSARSCFWSMAGTLGSLDVLAITHVGHENLQGLSTMLSRKIQEGASQPPEIDHLFFNSIESNKGGEGEVNGVDSQEGLGVSLASEGKRMVDQLADLNVVPNTLSQSSKNPATPVDLYSKIGHGSLCLYLINPVEGSKELETFLKQWKEGSFSVGSDGVSVPDQASVAFILVWYPHNAKKIPTRILYPGKCSPEKLAEGLERLKNLPVFRSFSGKTPPAPSKAAPSKAAPSKPGLSKKSPVASASSSQTRRPAAGPGKKAADGQAAPPPSDAAPLKKPAAKEGAAAPSAAKKDVPHPTAAAKKELAAKKTDVSPAASASTSKAASPATPTKLPAKLSPKAKPDIGKSPKATKAPEPAKAAKAEPAKAAKAEPAKAAKAEPAKATKPEVAKSAKASKAPEPIKATKQQPDSKPSVSTNIAKPSKPQETKAKPGESSKATSSTAKSTKSPLVPPASAKKQDLKKKDPTKTTSAVVEGPKDVPQTTTTYLDDVIPFTMSPKAIPAPALSYAAAAAAPAAPAAPVINFGDSSADDVAPSHSVPVDLPLPAPAPSVTLFADDLNSEDDPLAERARELLFDGAINGIDEEPSVSKGLATALAEDPKSCSSPGNLGAPNIQVTPSTPETDRDSSSEWISPAGSPKGSPCKLNQLPGVESNATDEDVEHFTSDAEPFEEQEEDPPLHGKKSPVSRISGGGNLYGAVNSPEESYVSLDASDIGIRAQGEVEGQVPFDTPGSLNNEEMEVIVKRLPEGKGLDTNAPSMNLKTQQQQQEPSLTVDTRPLVSNPLSGDEGSLLSSPESLSPNAEFAAEVAATTLIFPPVNLEIGVAPTTATIIEAIVESPDSESGIADIGEPSMDRKANNTFDSGDFMTAAPVSPVYRKATAGETSFDSDSLLTISQNSPMDAFDPFGAGAKSCTNHDDPNQSSGMTPCTMMTPEMVGLTLDSPLPELVLSSNGSGAPFVDDLLAEDAVMFRTAKEGSPFGNNGFPEANTFNQMVKTLTDEDDDVSSSLSPQAQEFIPHEIAPTEKGKSLSPDAPSFMPKFDGSGDSSAVVDAWGPPLGLPPPKPRPASGAAAAKPGSAAPGAKAKPAAAARPGTGQRRAGSPASSTASGTASKRPTTGTAVKKGASIGGKDKTASPAPIPITPFFVDVAYIPNQGKSVTLGKFFSRVRSKNYVLSCVDPPASTLDALLHAKENVWSSTGSGDEGEMEAETPTLLIPTHESETLRTWLPANLDKLVKHKIEISKPASVCTLQLQGQGESTCPCYVIQL